jgi:hypothetical protein
MTNTNTNSVTQAPPSGRDLTMQNWIDYSQAMVRARIEPLEAVAAAERLANAGATNGSSLGMRSAVGHALIRVGRAIASEPQGRHRAHGRPHAA